MAPLDGGFDSTPIWHIAMPGAGAIHPISGVPSLTVDDRRIHERARAQRYPLVGEVAVHLGEQLLGQRVRLQQVAEVQDRRLVRDPVIAKLDAREVPHGVAVIQHLLGHRVAQRIPFAGGSTPAASSPGHRRAPAFRPRLRIVRLDQRKEPGPRHHCVHLGEEFLTPRLLLLHRVAEAGMAGCLGIGGPPSWSRPVYLKPLRGRGFSDFP